MRRIDAHALQAVFRQMEPQVYAEDENGYD